MRWLQKLKTELLHDSAILLMGIHPKEMKTGYPRETHMPLWRDSWVTIVRIWNNLSVRQWTMRRCCVCAHTHTQWTTIWPWEKRKLCHCQQWMDLEDIMLNEISQIRHDSCLLCAETKKAEITKAESKMVTRGCRVGEWERDCLKVHTWSLEVSKSQRPTAQCSDYRQQKCIMSIKPARWLDLNCSQH